MTENLLTIANVADRLSCSTRHVRRIIASGELPVIAIGSGSRGDRVREEDLGSYITRKLRTRGTPELHLSANVVAFGTSTSKSAASGLDELLGKWRPGRKRKSSTR